MINPEVVTDAVNKLRFRSAYSSDPRDIVLLALLEKIEDIERQITLPPCDHEFAMFATDTRGPGPGVALCTKCHASPVTTEQGDTLAARVQDLERRFNLSTAGRFTP